MYIYIYATPPKTYHSEDFTGICSVFNVLHETNLTARFGSNWVLRRCEWPSVNRTSADSIEFSLGICNFLHCSHDIRIEIWERNTEKINTALWPNAIFHVYIVIYKKELLLHQTQNFKFWMQADIAMNCSCDELQLSRWSAPQNTRWIDRQDKLRTSLNNLKVFLGSCLGPAWFG